MKTDTKLFPIEKVKKFFTVLERFSCSTPIDTRNYLWKDYQTIYTKDSNHCPSTREVFVHRTINKWLKGKYLIIYKESSLGHVYKQYINITSLSYHNDWGQGYINVGLLDYSNPFDEKIFGGAEIKRNDAIALEGEWCDGKIHQQLLNLITMWDIPEKEYVFKAWDFSKYNKKTKSFEETTVTLRAKTIQGAYKEKKNFEKKCKETKSNLTIASDIIEIREI